MAPMVMMPSMPRLRTPGALADQRAERAEDQRRGDAQDRAPQAGGEEDFQRFASSAHPVGREQQGRRAWSSSEMETITSAMKLGTPSARLMLSAPTKTMATNSAVQDHAESD